jgi:hypothetical protein
MTDREDQEEIFSYMKEANGKFCQWLTREKQVYLRHTGRDGTLEGFREHVLKMVKTNPAVGELFLHDFVTAYVEAWPPSKP